MLFNSLFKTLKLNLIKLIFSIKTQKRPIWQYVWKLNNSYFNFSFYQQWATFARVWHVYDAKWQNPFESAKVIKQHLMGLHKPIYHPMSKFSFIVKQLISLDLKPSNLFIFRQLRWSCRRYQYRWNCAARWRMEKASLFPSHRILGWSYVDIGLGIAPEGSNAGQNLDSIY